MPELCICGRKMDSYPLHISNDIILDSIRKRKLCGDCWAKIQFSPLNKCCKLCSYPLQTENQYNSICASCIQKQPYYDRLYYGFKYDDESKVLITHFKFYDKSPNIKLICSLIQNNFNRVLQLEEVEILSSVPLHPKRLRQRLFNQSSEICKELWLNTTKTTQLQLNLLRRTRNTAPQTTLKKGERSKNVKDCFELNRKFTEEIKDKVICIIDDVYTTGATTNEISRILKKAGARKVIIYCCSRKFIE